MKAAIPILAVILAVLFAACAPVIPAETTVPEALSAVEPYAVYLASGTEAEGVFTIDADSFVSPDTDAAPSFDYPARIALQIGSKTVEMDYNRTGVNAHRY